MSTSRIKLTDKTDSITKHLEYEIYTINGCEYLYVHRWGQAGITKMDCECGKKPAQNVLESPTDSTKLQHGK